jgi:hypothetical protein
MRNEQDLGTVNVQELDTTNRMELRVRNEQDEAPDSDSEEDGDRSLNEFGRSFCFCFFFTNLVALVLWYRSKYNPTGTTNPSWTQVFG